MRLFLALSIALFLSAGTAPAQDGAKIAAEGTPDGAVPACDGCHQSGEGPFPLLAGQDRDYLLRQLDDFRSGKRINDMMAPIAAALPPAQAKAVAVWYAGQRKRRAAADKSAPELVARGRAVALEGRPGQQIPPCQRCHGEDAILNFASLDGQNPDYLVEQIQAFRDKRRTPLDPMMNQVARNITDEDARAVAAWYLEQIP